MEAYNRVYNCTGSLVGVVKNWKFTVQEVLVMIWDRLNGM